MSDALRDELAEIISNQQGCGSCESAPPYCQACLEDVAPLLAIIDRWLVENNRQVAEKAWNEGAQHVFEGSAPKCEFAKDGEPCPYNPYGGTTDDW
jgi:hypothetical protein